MEKREEFGYVLVSPSGKMVKQTFSLGLQGCQQKAFDYLYVSSTLNNYTDTKKRTRPHWSTKFWKKWDEFVAARVKRGWVIKRARIHTGETITEKPIGE